MEARVGKRLAGAYRNWQLAVQEHEPAPEPAAAAAAFNAPNTSIKRPGVSRQRLRGAVVQLCWALFADERLRRARTRIFAAEKRPPNMAASRRRAGSWKMQRRLEDDTDFCLLGERRLRSVGRSRPKPTRPPPPCRFT